jgi:hypothetical protein
VIPTARNQFARRVTFENPQARLNVEPPDQSQRPPETSLETLG